METRDNERYYSMRLNSPEFKDQYRNNNMIKGYLSRQFLEDLKAQMNRKIKPSKSILEALKHSTVLNQNYKKQIQELAIRINELRQQNEGLKIKLNQIQQNANFITNIRVISPKKRKNLEITPLQIISLKCDSMASSQNFEMEMIKQQLKHFQEYKVLKQHRFQQMVERQAKLVGQISMIKYKNETLQARISDMQDITKSKEAEGERGIFNNTKSECSQKFNDYINQDDEIQIVKQLNVQKNIESNCLAANYNKSMMMSRTEEVIIQQEYNIQKQIVNSVNCKKEYNEIDAILEVELPKTKTQEYMRENNLNSSVICIDINAQNHSNLGRINQNMNSSIVCIDLNAQEQKDFMRIVI